MLQWKQGEKMKADDIILVAQGGAKYYFLRPEITITQTEVSSTEIRINTFVWAIVISGLRSSLL